ncbi:MAG: zinc-dependent peptidase [Chitinophagaceae bacterium]|nr:zinc-dependent peptidase [Chitinophagaceae bacterium]
MEALEVLIVCLIVSSAVLVIYVLQPLVEKFLLARKRKAFGAQEDFYRELIAKHIPYFHRLDEEQQAKFLFRTFLFQKAKKFHYVGVRQSPEMPILISAVATQLTLGLEKFSLNYFRDIFVLEHDYHYGYYSLPFMGHVDSSGIYFSWNDFMQGIKNNPDSSNVGLHEMAHALAYVNFVTKTDEDKHFKKEFKNFSKVARPIYQEMQKGRKTLLGEYACTNYHEFWAVSVEMFFENSVRFKHELPQLYAAMANLLNQDPIEQIKYKRNIIYRQIRTTHVVH